MKLTLSEAANRLLMGDVVAIPTETVYGLAARLDDQAAVRRIFALKGRPQDNPLIVHVASEEQLVGLIRNEPADLPKLARFWPGPLTVVFEARPNAVPEIVRAGLPTVGIRMPAHELTLDLLAQTGPLVAPSANLSGKPSATTAGHVEADFGKDFPVLDGGPCGSGVESTIIGHVGGAWRLLRRGAIPAEALEQALGTPLAAHQPSEKPLSPGQKYRHYAPACRLILCPRRGDLSRLVSSEKAAAVLGFDDSPVPAGLPLVSLGARDDIGSALKRLYAALRELDEGGFAIACVDADFAATGLGLTLKDRLDKAVQG